MQNKSISFNEEMLKAILNGRKTQTRRICHGATEIELDEVFEYPYYSERIGDNFSNNDFDFIFTPKYNSGKIYQIKDSELKIKITKGRLEKLQDITEQDAVAEGFGLTPKDIAKEDKTPSITWFRGLWDSIYGNDKSKQWEANPWVWVYEFERV